MFLLRIGGKGIHRFSVAWTHPKFYKLMYAFFFWLYDPSDFMDPSYMNMDPLVDQVMYTIHISLKTEVDGVKREEESESASFSLIYATNPFGTCTHILLNPCSDVMIGNKVLTAFKDQLCRPDPQFNEYTVLTHIHSQEGVPGVSV